MISQHLKMAAFAALFGYALFLTYKTEPPPLKKKRYIVLGLIMSLYFAGKLVDEVT